MRQNSHQMKKSLLLICLSIIGISPVALQAQRKKDKEAEAVKPAIAPPATASIADKVKKCKKIEGLFTLYRDTTSGSLMMLIKKDQINKEFIYFSYVENGNTTTGHNKGTFRDNKIFTIKKYYNQIEFITQNTSFYFDPSNAISKSADANITNAVMSSEKVVASDESKGEYLIEADNLFLTETLYQIKRGGMPSPGVFNLGMLSKSKTRYDNIRNYPENTDIVVRYVYDDPSSRGTGSEAITDGRYVDIRLQHSFIAMPEEGFTPRMDDPRIGYFSTQVNDMTTTDAINYRDLIHRWRLVKKDPGAALSEPVKPIVWWIENTTPKELRPTIKEAILQWNIAFEKAGFKNAVQIFEQPDDATWDAGDIRYNVLRWTSSPEPPFGGYGPSFVNPRTGEILGADIMLEWVFITNRLKSQKVFDKAGLEWLMELEQTPYEDPHGCAAGEHMHMQNLLGLQYLAMNNADELEVSNFIKESLYYLVLHEVGHTMGLNHNMKASQLHSPDALYDITKTSAIGLTGSVMDYPAVNFSNRKGLKTQYYTTRPGPYDLWAIEFGYYQENDAASDKTRRETILMRSTEPQLCFGNDADDMRAPGKAIDPRVMIGDMSSDAIGFAKERIGLIKTLQGSLLSEYGKQNRSYQELRNSYFVLTSEWATQAGVVSRYIGGIYVDRSFSNQVSTVKPLTPVPYETQKNAMKLLTESVFAPNAMEIPTDLLPYLQQQRRGFNFFSSGEDPKILDRVLNVQNMVLMHVLHPNTLQRISDSKLYGNKYDLSEVFKDLSTAIFAADMTGDINMYRQNLQSLYIQYLTFIVESPVYDYISKAKAHNQLLSLQKQIQLSLPSSIGNAKEHKIYILSSIKTALEGKK